MRGPPSEDRDPREIPQSCGSKRGHYLAPLLVADCRVRHQGGHRADQHHPDPELVELARPEPVGGDDGPTEDLHHGLLVGRFGQAVPQASELGVELAPHHIRLRLVVPEEGPPRYPDSRGDLVDRGVVVALTGEEIEGGPGHVLARGAGRAATSHLGFGHALPDLVPIRSVRWRRHYVVPVVILPFWHRVH